MSVINRNKPVKVPIGMRRSWWAPFASEPDNALPIYGTVQDMGAARLGTLTVTTAAADIDGDDLNLVHVENFVSGTLVAETTLSDLQLNASVYGHGYDGGVSTSGAEDASPNGAYAFIEPMLQKDKTTVYRATFLPKVSANAANEAQSAATRQGTSINPTYNSVTYTVYACNTGAWRLQQDFPTEAAAETWLMGLFGATAAWEVSVELIGSGTVTPAGTNFVAAGQTATLTFSPAPTVLYDGTVDVTASLVDGVYTIPAIAAAHHLVAVFST